MDSKSPKSQSTKAGRRNNTKDSNCKQKDEEKLTSLRPARKASSARKNSQKEASTQSTPKSSILVRVDYLDAKAAETPTQTFPIHDQKTDSQPKKSTRSKKKTDDSIQQAERPEQIKTPASSRRTKKNLQTKNLMDESTLDDVSLETFANPETFQTPTGPSKSKITKLSDDILTPATPSSSYHQEMTPISEFGSPTPSKRGRKRKIPDSGDESSPKRIFKNVVCGVCHKEIPEPNFQYHRYSVHMGLARAKGLSQEFTESEKKQELKKTIQRMKKVSCPTCGSNFTTAPGYLYHAARCGESASESAEKRQQECKVCGKKVVVLKAHMKIHEREAAREEAEREAEKLSQMNSKSKRVAAVKAANLLSEVADDIGESGTKCSKQVERLFVEPASKKVTNSVIGVWKRQLAKESIAACRHPGCVFKAESLDDLKAHHISCEIGAKMRTFACTKCEFRCPERQGIIDHVISSHVVENDAGFDVDSDASCEDLDELEVSDEEEEDFDSIGTPRRSQLATPSNLRHMDKLYGLSATDLNRFKTHPTSPLIPKWLAQFHKKHYSWSGTPLYGKFQPVIRDQLSDTCRHLPTWKESLPFARRKIAVHNLHQPVSGLHFERLGRFQGKLVDGTPMFFCGGRIQSAAWCPLPFESDPTERHQFLAVCTLKEEDRFRGANQSPVQSEYAIQLWNCGALCNSRSTETPPKLEFCIAHSFGRVWDIEWCPSGCYDETRIGLLAAACSDGSVHLFSVPRPSAFHPSPQRITVHLMDPSLTLKLNVKDQSECTALNWDSTRGHRFIAAGFANGTVAVWDLQTQSPLLKQDCVIWPVWSFYGHSSIVTGVSLCPHHSEARFLATCSVDRTLKLWDRFDSRVPVVCSKKARITQLRWRRHWPGVLVSVEDVFALFRTCTTFYDFGYTNTKQALLPQNSVSWCSTENEYLDIIGHCTAAGEVVLYSSHVAVIEPDDKKLRRTRSMVFRTDVLDASFNDSQNGDESVTLKDQHGYLNHMKKVYLTPQNSKKPKRPKESPQKFQKAKNYSLVYNDVITVRSVGKSSGSVKSMVSESMDIALPNDEPVATIRKISYNPNLESHLWMCLCGENGTVQLLRFDSTVASKMDEIYRQELNK